MVSTAQRFEKDAFAAFEIFFVKKKRPGAKKKVVTPGGARKRRQRIFGKKTLEKGIRRKCGPKILFAGLPGAEKVIV